MRVKNREEIIKGMTNEALKDKFQTEMGQKAVVERSEIENERMHQLREVLADIGRDVAASGEIPKGMEYVGSLSVHVYKSEILRTAAFMQLSNLGTLDYHLADAALRELTGQVYMKFGKEKGKRRSGTY